MTDYRSVLERDLRRVGNAPFVLDDVARRRERKQRNRRIAAGAVALVLVALVIGGWLGALTLDRSAPASRPNPTTVADPTPCVDGTTCWGPGTYTARFWPRLILTLPDGRWRFTSYDQIHIHLQVVRLHVDDPYDYRNLPSWNPTVLVTREPGLSSGCHTNNELQGSPGTPEGLAAAIANLPYIQAQAPVPVSLGGLTGVSLDVEVPEEGRTCDQGYAVLSSGFGTEAADLDAGDRSRIILLQIPRSCSCVEPGEDGLIAIEFSGPIDEFDRIVAEVQPVLDSFGFDLDAERRGKRGDVG
jgi:hypothetical protein